MLRILCALLLAGSLAGCASNTTLELWSQPVYDGFGIYASKELRPVTIALKDNVRGLAGSTNLATEVVSYGSGNDIYVNLLLDKSVKSASRADLIYTAILSAFVCQYA